MIAAGFILARGVPTGSRTETTLAMTPAAAVHATARARVPLDGAWLDRWRRSDAKFPSDVPTTAQAAFTERILGAAQFTTGG